MCDPAKTTNATYFNQNVIDPKSISDQLRIIQRGNDPNHYEITPRPGADLKPEQYIKLCSNIKFL
jgi:hypothetical protein